MAQDLPTFCLIRTTNSVITPPVNLAGFLPEGLIQIETVTTVAQDLPTFCLIRATNSVITPPVNPAGYLPEGLIDIETVTTVAQDLPTFCLIRTTNSVITPPVNPAGYLPEGLIDIETVTTVALTDILSYQNDKQCHYPACKPSGLSSRGAHTHRNCHYGGPGPVMSDLPTFCLIRTTNSVITPPVNPAGYLPEGLIHIETVSTVAQDLSCQTYRHSVLSEGQTVS